MPSPSMTKKNFIAIAEAFRAERQLYVNENGRVESSEALIAHDTLLRMAKRTADVCHGFNRNFDRSRFLTACGF